MEVGGGDSKISLSVFFFVFVLNSFFFCLIQKVDISFYGRLGGRRAEGRRGVGVGGGIRPPKHAFHKTELIVSSIMRPAQDFEFFYDLGHNDVRVELDMIFSQEQWNEMQQTA